LIHLNVYVKATSRFHKLKIISLEPKLHEGKQHSKLRPHHYYKIISHYRM